MWNKFSHQLWVQTKASLPGRTHKLSSITSLLCSWLESSVSWLHISIMCPLCLNATPFPQTLEEPHFYYTFIYLSWPLFEKKLIFSKHHLTSSLTGIKANESTDVPSVARTVLLYGLRKCRLARVKRLRALILDFMERIMEPRPRLSDDLHLFSGMTFLLWQKVLLVKLPIILTWVIWWDVRLILEIWILLEQRSVKQHYTSTCSWDFIVNIRLSCSTISNLI